MSLRIISVLILSSFSFSLLSQSSGHTLEEKAASLFVANGDSLNKNYKYSPRYILSSNNIKSTKYNSEKSFIIADGVVNGFDQLSLPFPGVKTLNFISADSKSDAFLPQSLRYVKALGYDGLLMAAPKKHTLNLQLTNQKRVFDVVYFPSLIIEKMNGVSPFKTTKEIADDLNYCSDDTNIDCILRGFMSDEAFESLLNKQTLFYTSNFARDHAILVNAYKNRSLNMALLNHVYYENNAWLDDSGLKESLEEQKKKQLAMRLSCMKEAVSAWQTKSVLPITNVANINIEIWDYRQTKDSTFYELVNFYAPSISYNSKLPKHILILCEDASRSLEIQKRLKAESLPPISIILTTQLEKWENEVSKKFKPDVLISATEHHAVSWAILAQALFNGSAINGQQVLAKNCTALGYKTITTQKNRLGFAFPESVGMSSEILDGIDPIILSAIKQKATPGAQILVACKGDIIYHKPFGYTQYDHGQKVNNDMLYDIASLTKLIATMPLVMKGYEQKTINLNAKVATYIPQIAKGDKKDMTIQELLLHQSGLKSSIAFHYNAIDYGSIDKSLFSNKSSSTYSIQLDKTFFQNKLAKYRSDVFQNYGDSTFTIKVSANWFMNSCYLDSMNAQLYATKLSDKKVYRYSDLGYMYLQKVIENTSKQPLDSLFYKEFARPLGTSKLVYKPVDTYDVTQIVPTEEDIPFRKELLQGYVHDQTAAMLGGVAAHAGLFSNTADLAKISQMFLDKGTYGGVNYLSPTTFDLFTTATPNGNRRGLGVDKPELDPQLSSPASRLVSPISYGHTGFTGTIVWIDPQYDLIYIFLSNRIHPRAYNKKLVELGVRTNIQDVIYRSLDDLKK